MGYIFVLGYVVIVGLATFLMKAVLKTITPYQLNVLMGVGMFLTGVPALLIAQKSLRIPIKEFPLGLLIGVMMAGGSLLYVLAFSKLNAGVAAVLASAYVIVVILLSWIFLKEHMDTAKIAGLALTFIGIAILTFKS